MRKVRYYVACTADRFIAAQDGSFDAFLAQGEHLRDLFREFPETVPAHMREAVGVQDQSNRVFDAVLMGRATYEVGLRYGVTNPYPHLKQYLFSTTLKSSPDSAVELVRGDASSVVKQMKRVPGQDIWLCGGGILAAALFDEIDELILKVNPVILGCGVPLFARCVSQTPLQLTGARTYSNGFALMRYRLEHT